MLEDHTNAELEQAIREPRGRRFLAPTGSGGNGAYVSQPLRGVPEVQSDASEAAARAVEVSPEVAERIRAAATLYDEPESIGAAVASYVEVAHKVDSLRRAREIEDMRERRRSLSLEQRMEDARQRAKRQHVDISHELHVIAKALERARRSQREGAVPESRDELREARRRRGLEPPAAVRRMEAVEALLDRPPEDVVA
jgi:hypothetical protein